MFGEPQPTPYDVRFSLLGFPIRISPWFWVVAIVLSGGHGGGAAILVWVLAVLASIVIHELGHALAFRYFGISSHIVLYHFGGLAVPNSWGGGWGRQAMGSWQQAAISAAGPLAQILAAVVVVVVVGATGHGVGSLGIFDYAIPELDQPRFESLPLAMFLQFFCFVSFYWAAFNLVPVFPLDGGQITRSVLAAGGANNPIAMSLTISVVAAGAMFLWGLQQRNLFLCFLFGSLGYASYQGLSQMGGGGGFRPRAW